MRSAVAQKVVDGIGREQAGDDGHLICRAHASANRWRRNFRNIHGRKQRNAAHGQASDKTGENKNCEAWGKCGGDGRDHKQERHPNQHALAAIAVREPAGNIRSQHATEEQGTEGPSKAEIAEPEAPRKKGSRASNDGDIEPEKQAAQRGNRRHEQHERSHV